MRESTTIRVSPETRDALRDLAEGDGITLDTELARLLRAERQRRMGAALAQEPSDDYKTWLDAGIVTIRDHARG